MMFKCKHRYQEQAGVGGDAGGGASTVLGAAGGDTIAGAAGGDSVLALGKGDGGHDWIPEKFRVLKDDGALDSEASLRKIIEPYTHLEKRMGSGNAPPKEASEYKLNIPDALKDKIDPEKLATDEKFVELRDRWHKAGLTQAQFDVAAGDFFSTAVDIAEQLAGDAAPMTFEAAQEELRKTWKTDAEFKAGARDAYRAAVSTLGEDGATALMTKHGNDPQIVLMLAAFGREMQEDRPANSGAGAQGSAETINSLMLSEAYQNPRHPEHAAVSMKVKAHFERTHGTAQAL